MISEGYVQNGARVYISSRDAKACNQACDELNALGKGSAFAIPADFYKEEDCKKMAAELGKREKGECTFADGELASCARRKAGSGSGSGRWALVLTIPSPRRTPRLGEQLRQQLGRAVRGISRRGVGARSHAQPAAGIHHHAAADAAVGIGGQGERRPVSRHQHRQRGWPESAWHGDVCLLRQQSWAAPFESRVGASLGTKEDHVSRFPLCVLQNDKDAEIWWFGLDPILLRAERSSPR